MYRVELKIITPEYARELLEKTAALGFQNRPLSLAILSWHCAHTPSRR